MPEFELLNYDSTYTTDNKRVVIVEIVGYRPDRPDKAVTFIGTAICDPEDTFDLYTGLFLAQGRALREMSRSSLRIGNGYVRKSDDARKAQVAANEKMITRRRAAAAAAKRAYAKTKKATKSKVK